LPAVRILLVLLLLTLAACANTRIGVSSGVSSEEYAALDLISKVKTALLNDAVVGARRIDVHATAGDIILSGRVASEAERDRAVQIARSVDGVTSVSSRLEIRP
jgi:hyperosmotically inducible protein